MAAPAAPAQSILNNNDRSGYHAETLVEDLRWIACDVPIGELVDAYVEYATAWIDARGDAWAAVARAVPGDEKRLGKEAIEEIIRAVKRERSRSMAAESRLFERLAAAAPACSEGIQRIREWRRTYHARAMARVPWTMHCFSVDIGERARWLKLHDEARRAVIERLAASEAGRRIAFERLERARLAFEIAEAELVDAAALDNIDPDEAGPPMLGDDHEATARYRGAVADYLESQLRAFRDIAPLLPPSARRALMDSAMSCLRLRNTRSETQGLPSVGIPFWTGPSDVGRLVLAWRDLAPDRRKATRESIKAWLDQSDALTLRLIESQIDSLRHGRTGDETIRHELAGPTSWATLAAAYLPQVAEASGARWLLEPTESPPPTRSGDYHEDDRDVTGLHPADFEGPTADTSKRRIADLVPAPLSDIDRLRLLDAVAGDEHAGAKLQILLADHAERWSREVEPMVAKALAITADDFHDLDPARLDAARGQSTVAHAERIAAFAAADRLDDDLYSAAEAVVGDDTLARVRRGRASRNSGSVLDRHGTWRLRGNTFDAEVAGGGLFDVAAALDDEGISPDARRAAERAVADGWSATVLLARELRQLQLDVALQDRLHLIERHGAGCQQVPAWEAAVASLQQREAQLLHRGRREAARLQAAMLDAVGSMEGAGEALRYAFRKQQFPQSMQESIRHRSIVKQLRDLPELDGRAALEARLATIGSMIDDLAERSIKPCLPSLGLPANDRTRWWDMHPHLLRWRWDLRDTRDALIAVELLLVAGVVPPKPPETSD